MPFATTLKLALAPTSTVALAGCVEIEGGVVPAVIVTVSLVLVTEPAAFVMTTLYTPASALVTLLSVSDAVVAVALPEIGANVVPPLVLFCHW